MNVSVDFTALGLLPKIAKQMETMQNDILDLKQQLKQQQKYDLTKRAGVKAFLNISDSTIAKYLKEGTFREGYHFYREIKGTKTIIVFVSGAIEEFKKSREKRFATLQ
ncbi:hypothetical protein H0A43_03215 [Arcobacter lanthieri]|uniref:hypothetical protein n=1 Tax=Aliarcobacter lanthieri TaxID=1355374 RepID=UPI0019235493|nr:hypothetical protein [Aliarcobacter lanthieri]MBL3519466.1 hypothetical protein [Aliarcobacter lanthieri]